MQNHHIQAIWFIILQSLEWVFSLILLSPSLLLDLARAMQASPFYLSFDFLLFSCIDHLSPSLLDLDSLILFCLVKHSTLPSLSTSLANFKPTPPNHHTLPFLFNPSL